jgi:hypothetical protein
MKINFLNLFRFGSFFGKKFCSNKVPHLKFILLKYYLAEKAENFISVSRIHAEKNKEWFVKMFIDF